MTEVKAPMQMYEMSPAYYGVAVIAVTTGENFLNLIKMYGEDVSDYDQVQGNESKTMILPAFDLGEGIAVSKGLGTFLDGTLEEELNKEGYVVINLGA